MSDCEQPHLGTLRLIAIQAHEIEEYKLFCLNHNVPLISKNLQRLADGSSFWCLLSEEGNILSSGWLGYKQTFYIGETDYIFDMRKSQTAILYDFNTKPEHRGNGYYGLLLKSIVFNAAAPERYIIYTSPDNTANSKGILKAGFKFNGKKSASDQSLKSFLRNEGFTSIMQKYQLWGLKIVQ